MKSFYHVQEPCIKISFTGGIFSALTALSCDYIFCSRILHTLRAHTQGHSGSTAHSSAEAAITHGHRLGGLNKRHTLSHCFRDQKPVIRQSHTSSNTRQGSVPSFSPWLSEGQVLPVSLYHLLFIRTQSHWINDPP